MHDLLESAAPSRRATLTRRTRRNPPATPPSAVGIRYVVQQLVTSAPLLAADVLTLAIVCWGASVFPGPSGGPLLLQALPYLAVALVIVNAINGLYPAIGVHPAEELRMCGTSTSTIAVTSCALSFASTDAAIGVAWTGVGVWLGLLFAIPAARAGVRVLASHFDIWAQPVLIVGDVRRGALLARELESSRFTGLRPLGIVTTSMTQWSDDLAVADDDLALCVGVLEEASTIASRHGVYWAIIIDSEAIQSHDRDIDVENYLSNIPHRLYTIEEHHRNERDTFFAEPASINS